jgi:hypothetical protein
MAAEKKKQIRERQGGVTHDRKKRRRCTHRRGTGLLHCAAMNRRWEKAETCARFSGK